MLKALLRASHVLRFKYPTTHEVVLIGSTSERKTKAKSNNLLHIIINYCALPPNWELKFLIYISFYIFEHV